MESLVSDSDRKLLGVGSDSQIRQLGNVGYRRNPMKTCEFVPERYILFDLRPTSFLNYIQLHVSILSVVHFNSLFNAK